MSWSLAPAGNQSRSAGPLKSTGSLLRLRSRFTAGAASFGPAQNLRGGKMQSIALTCCPAQVLVPEGKDHLQQWSSRLQVWLIMRPRIVFFSGSLNVRS